MSKERIDFLNPDVFRNIETECYKAGRSGTTIDYSEFPAAEYRYFERLCGVYASYNRGEITLDEAKAKKQLFYKDYRNYYYLPSEDEAIHKSIAQYVDSSNRVKCTAANCYTRKTGAFVPEFGGTNTPVFKKAIDKTPFRYMTGAFYFYDNTIVHNRAKITTVKNDRNPCDPSLILGYINI